MPSLMIIYLVPPTCRRHASVSCLNLHAASSVQNSICLQAIPAGQSAVFSICLRSSSAKSFRHAVEFIINGLHFLHFDIHADVIDPMLSLSHSELEFALSTNDWLNYCDKVVLLENPNKFPCSFQWQVPSPTSFTVTPMTGTVRAAGSLEAVIRWTQDKDATGNHMY